MKEIDETIYVRRDGTKFIRTRVWYEFGTEKPLHEFIGELERVLLSIPLEFRSEAVFEQSEGQCFGDGDFSAGSMEIYYDRDISCEQSS